MAGVLACNLALGFRLPIPLIRAQFGKAQKGTLLGLILGVAVSSAWALAAWLLVAPHPFGWLDRERKRDFFFEKKEAKNFCSSADCVWLRRCLKHHPSQKSFFASFCSQKEVLPFLKPYLHFSGIPTLSNSRTWLTLAAAISRAGRTNAASGSSVCACTRFR